MGAASVIPLLEEAQAGPARTLMASAQSAHLDIVSPKWASEPGAGERAPLSKGA